MRLNFLKNNIILIYIKPHLKSILNNERRYNYENNSGEALTADAFRQYGTFWSAVDGEGYGLGGGFFTFYPDRIAVSSEKRIGFSTLKVR